MLAKRPQIRRSDWYKVGKGWAIGRLAYCSAIRSVGGRASSCLSWEPLQQRLVSRLEPLRAHGIPWLKVRHGPKCKLLGSQSGHNRYSGNAGSDGNHGAEGAKGRHDLSRMRSPTCSLVLPPYFPGSDKHVGKAEICPWALSKSVIFSEKPGAGEANRTPDLPSWQGGTPPAPGWPAVAGHDR